MYSIARLKRLLIQTESLSELWNYFYDLMDKKILLQGGRAISNPAEHDVLTCVLAVIQQSVSQQLKQQISFLVPMFSETPSENLYQGSCIISGIFIPAAVFYFSDIEMGSFSYAQGEQCEMFRFSLTKMNDPKTLIKH
jgi:hypothetical protein